MNGTHEGAKEKAEQPHHGKAYEMLHMAEHAMQGDDFETFAKSDWNKSWACAPITNDGVCMHSARARLRACVLACLRAYVLDKEHARACRETREMKRNKRNWIPGHTSCQ